MLQIGRVLPAPPLRGLIERYWWCAGATELPVVFPGTGAEFWIHLAGGVELDGAPLPRAHAVCLRRTRWSLKPRSEASFVAVRFRAGALRHFTGQGLAELADRVVSAEDLWGRLGNRIVEQVAEAGPPSRSTAWARALDRGLEELRRSHGREESRVDVAVRVLHARPGTARVDGLASELGLTTRQLQRTFPRAAGATPKEFQRLARFRSVVRPLLLSGSTDYVHAALDAGFYDQSHFIREFRRITGESPMAVLGRGTSHFYYPSLPEGPETRH
ncbi:MULTISPECIES: helix-turn-helix domain-containing protein [unclassified Actinomadura]|uniref:helix-turn-helix domain-containing protein n=1 Tax=unclassified Actinomadura TaxID=2626254 RepID=UPI0011EDEDEF|nr:helix-turn-helix domain-containing protein [Actinomadura sp. K4S16]